MALAISNNTRQTNTIKVWDLMQRCCSHQCFIPAKAEINSATNAKSHRGTVSD